MVQIAPSILSADFVNLQRDIERISNADMVHVDVMDYHFVPNMTFGLPIAERIKQISPIPVDAHLMIANPDELAVSYAEVGYDSVTFHAEAAAAPVRLARELRKHGARAGMAIKPATGIAEITDLLPEIDMLLVMTVEPGFGGQSFIDWTLKKIATARKLISESNLQVSLQVDGGISKETIAKAAEAGANVFVAGSAVYGAEDAAEAVSELRELAAAHFHH